MKPFFNYKRRGGLCFLRLLGWQLSFSHVRHPMKLPPAMRRTRDETVQK